MYKFTS